MKKLIDFVNKIPFIKNSPYTVSFRDPVRRYSNLFLEELIGWCITDKTFRGMYQAKDGLNVFELSYDDLITKTRHYDIETVDEKEVGRISGNLPEDSSLFCCADNEPYIRLIHVLDYILVDQFLDGCTVDSEYYIPYKKIEEQIENTKKYINTFKADWEFVSQMCSEKVSLKIRGFAILLRPLKSKSKSDFYYLYSPDGLYKYPQINQIGSVVNGKVNYYDLANHVDGRCARSYESLHDMSPSTTYANYIGEDGVKEHYGSPWQQEIMKGVLQDMVPSRKPVACAQLSPSREGKTVLFRYKNGNLYASQLRVRNVRSNKVRLSKRDTGRACRQLLNAYATEGQVLMLDPDMNVPEFIEECKMYSLTGKL